MTDPRLPPRHDKRQPWARFRCPRCTKFVVATEYGVCPRCGMGPPGNTVSGPRDEEAWQRAAAPGRPGPAFFAVTAVLCLGLGAVLAAWALGLL